MVPETGLRSGMEGRDPSSWGAPRAPGSLPLTTKRGDRQGDQAWPGEEQTGASSRNECRGSSLDTNGRPAGRRPDGLGLPQARPHADQSPGSRQGSGAQATPADRGRQSERAGLDGALEHRIQGRKPRSREVRCGPPHSHGGRPALRPRQSPPLQAKLHKARQVMQETSTLRHAFKPT